MWLLVTVHHALHASHAGFAVVVPDRGAQDADVVACTSRSGEQRRDLGRYACGLITRERAAASTPLTLVFALEDVLLVEKTYARLLPLHVHTPTDPTGRRVVVGRGDLDVTVQMHDARSGSRTRHGSATTL